MMKKVNTIPEAVVFFDVFAQLGNISIFSLPRRLIVRQVAPFHQVPQRTVFHQSENEHRSTAFLTTFKTLTKFSQQQWSKINTTDNRLESYYHIIIV